MKQFFIVLQESSCKYFNWNLYICIDAIDMADAMGRFGMHISTIEEVSVEIALLLKLLPNNVTTLEA
jgi:hypothetical protein